MLLVSFSLRVKQDLRYGTYIFPIQIWNRLCDHVLFKVFLLRYILIGYTHVSFFKRLNFNNVSRNFLSYTIVVWLGMISHNII